MEAKLKAADGMAEDRSSEDMRRARNLAALDRYLNAVGIGDDETRHRLARSALETLTRCRAEAAPNDWEQMIAAVDQVLCAEHEIEPTADPRAVGKGRIAQRCRHAQGDFAAVSQRMTEDAGWAVPQPCRRQMPVQDLTISLPTRQYMESAFGFPSDVWRAQLLRLQLWRPAQGLTLGILCLAVVLVP